MGPSRAVSRSSSGATSTPRARRGSGRCWPTWWRRPPARSSSILARSSRSITTGSVSSSRPIIGCGRGPTGCVWRGPGRRCCGDARGRRAPGAGDLRNGRRGRHRRMIVGSLPLGRRVVLEAGVQVRCTEQGDQPGVATDGAWGALEEGREPAGADEDLDTVEEGDRGQVENDVRRAAAHAVEDWLLQPSGGLCVQPAADLDERGGIPPVKRRSGELRSGLVSWYLSPACTASPVRTVTSTENPPAALGGHEEQADGRSQAQFGVLEPLLFGLTLDQRW
jgi:hypothetical protein